MQKNEGHVAERIESVLGCIGDGVITVDTNGKIDFMNHTATLMTGWAEAEAIGKNVSEVFMLINSISGCEIESPIKQAITEKRAVGLKKNTVLRSRKGQLYYISASCSPVVYKNSDKNVNGAVIVFRDITNIKNMEDQLAREKSNLKAIFEEIPSGMIVIGKDDFIKNVNNAVLKMFGFKTSDLVGKKFGDGLNCIFSFEAGCGNGKHCKFCQVENAIHEVLKTEQAIRSQVIRKTFLTKIKTSPSWYKFSFLFINTEGENQIVIYIEDIAEQIIYEQNLKKAKEEAEKASKIKTIFLANMSHEIRTPINGIVGMIDLTLMSDLQKGQREDLLTAKKCANSLLNIINDILDFSKLEVGKIVLQRMPFALEELLGEIEKIHRISASEKNIEFKVLENKKLSGCLIGDAYRLGQALNNLIGNAIKFTNFGKVILQVELDEEKDNTIKVDFAIKDTGIGISNEDQKKLFKSFSQIDGSLTKEHRGTGLGLVITKQLVNAMGGDIQVQSALCRGSCFSFNLMFQIDQKSGLQNKNESKEMLQFKNRKQNQLKRLLVVEDNLFNQKFLLKFLKQKEYVVDLAENGIQAIEHCESQRYDIILMDIQLPLMDGVEVTKKIKKTKKLNQKTPIIAVTAFALSGDREKFIASGMDDYISKPIDLKLLEEKINYFIQKNKTSFYSKPFINKQGELEFIKPNEIEDTKGQLANVNEIITTFKACLERGDFQGIEKKCSIISIREDRFQNDLIKDILFKIKLLSRKEDDEGISVLIKHIEEIVSTKA